MYEYDYMMGSSSPSLFNGLGVWGIIAIVAAIIAEFVYILLFLVIKTKVLIKVSWLNYMTLLNLKKCLLLHF